MSDIVERLHARDWIPVHESEHASAMQPMCDEAADEIESLRQRVAELQRENADYLAANKQILKMMAEKRKELDAINGKQEPKVLFDGMAVYNAIPDHRKHHTSPENVADTLDAVVRLLRAEMKTEEG